MLKVYSCITQDHDPLLLAVAVAICLFAQLTAFILAADVRRMSGKPQLRWIAMLAFVTAAGIWATHFIAMLAYQPDLPSAYSPYLTSLSFLACIGLTFTAFTTRSRYLGGVLTTMGIGTMHLIGMAALQTAGRLEYDKVSVVVAIVAGGMLVRAASWAFGRSTARVPVVPALLLTLGIATIHFGAMSAITIIPDPRAVISDSAISPSSLAIAVVALVVSVLMVSFVMLRAESRLAANAVEEANRMKLFADKAMEGLAVVEGDAITDANDVFWTMAGYSAEARPDRLPIAAILPELATEHTIDRGNGFFETAMLRAADGALEIEVALRKTSMSGKPCTLLVVRDISDRKAAAAKIAHLASHDPLTGVGNRLTFNDALDARIAQAAPDHPLGLLCIDLDRFKPVNDLYGHLVGDTVLIEVTKRISSVLEKRELLARLGGDEFAVLTARTPEQASRLAAVILRELSTPFLVEDHMISIGASIGIAYAPTDADEAQLLHSRADLALYRAKSDGRGRFCFFDPGMDEQVIEVFRMKAELRNALAEGQLSLHYQPLASLKTDEVIGFEALVRWNHPELGEVSPATFIPLAEETGLIVPIGEWVLREACREAARWPNALKIAVNLSPVQFTAGNVVQMVASTLASTGLDPTRLDLEITEGVLVKDSEGALKILHALKALGVRISMDDFGTGYSSLSYFRQFPFDKVKIDQGFIQDMEVNPQSRAIIKAIIGLAKGLDIAILAEGVETENQMSMLKRKGCEQIQGYALGRPAPIGAFDDLVGVHKDDDGDEDRRVA